MTPRTLHLIAFLIGMLIVPKDISALSCESNEVLTLKLVSRTVNGKQEVLIPENWAGRLRAFSTIVMLRVVGGSEEEVLVEVSAGRNTQD